jgi:hypothetical protein
VMFSRAPDQRAVNVEKHQCIGWFQASTITSSAEQPGKSEESSGCLLGLTESRYDTHLLEHS